MASRSDNGRSFAVWSHIHGGNHGDDLVVETVLDALRTRTDDPELVTISMFPAGSVERHGVPSFPIGSVPSGTSRLQWAERLPGPLARVQRLSTRALAEARAAFESFRVLRKVDTLVIAGSGPLEDDPGCAYRLAKWVILARAAGAKVATSSVGAGPLVKPINQRFVKLALRLSHYRSVRDRSSAELVRSVGFDDTLLEKPDMGWAWKAVADASASLPEANRVGINVMSLNDPRYDRGIDIKDADWDRFNAYVNKLVEFVEYLVEDGSEVLFFSTETGHDVRVRKEVFEILRERAKVDVGRVILQDENDIDGLLAAVRSCSSIVSTRFHAAVVGISTGRRTLGLAYHPKTHDLFESLGIGDICLDAASFTVEELITAYESLPAIWEERAPSIRAGVEELRDEVQEQFDAIVSL